MFPIKLSTMSDDEFLRPSALNKFQPFIYQPTHHIKSSFPLPKVQRQRINTSPADIILFVIEL
jgi:hypothetical protein